MKTNHLLSLIITTGIISFNAYAVVVAQFDGAYFERVKEEYKEVAFDKQTEVTNLTKTVAYLQRNYEEKVNNLEVELNKTKSRLIEKSLNEEKIQSGIRESYEAEISNLRKELASKTRTVLEYQRLIEKAKPDDDAKNLIKINNELASELRKSEGQLAVLQLEIKKGVAVNPNVSPYVPATEERKVRKPASVEEAK